MPIKLKTNEEIEYKNPIYLVQYDAEKVGREGIHTWNRIHSREPDILIEELAVRDCDVLFRDRDDLKMICRDSIKDELHKSKVRGT